MKDKKSGKAATEAPPVRPFVSLYNRHRWIARVDKTLIQSDPGYYMPMMQPGEKGKEAYLKAMGSKYGCGTKYQPSDKEFAAFLCDVALERDMDYMVSMHCDKCFACQLLLMRMAYHIAADRPGSEWSAEIAAEYPMLVKGWDNEKYHLRVFLKSLKSGPSFHVYAVPFAKDKKQLIIGSAAGVFGVGEYPVKEFVLSTQKAMEKRAKSQLDFVQKIDPVLIAEFAKKLGFNVDDEIYEFLSPVVAPPKNS